MFLTKKECLKAFTFADFMRIGFGVRVRVATTVFLSDLNNLRKCITTIVYM